MIRTNVRGCGDEQDTTPLLMMSYFDEVPTELYCDIYLQKRGTLFFKISTRKFAEAMQVHTHLWIRHIGKGFIGQRSFSTPTPWFVAVRVVSTLRAKNRPQLVGCRPYRSLALLYMGTGSGRFIQKG
jgi:hypothetical protein